MDEIVAWHFLTESDRCTAEDVFQDLLEAGKLTASAYRKNPHLEPLDVMAKDDQFIFLSLYPHVTDSFFPERGIDGLPPGIYGFGFDTNTLIYDYNAKVRKKDLLPEYSHLMDDLLIEHYGKHIPYNFVPEETMDKFSEIALSLQTEFEFRGAKAMSYLEDITDECYSFKEITSDFSISDQNWDWDRGEEVCEGFRRVEILVPRELYLADAIYVVNDGVISF